MHDYRLTRRAQIHSLKAIYIRAVQPYQPIQSNSISDSVKMKDSLGNSHVRVCTCRGCVHIHSHLAGLCKFKIGPCRGPEPCRLRPVACVS